MSSADPLAALTREVERLVHRLRAATPTWYAARPAGGGTRAEMLRGLVGELAAFGARAGTGQPAGAAPTVLGEHALGDQLTLLAHEIVAAPGGAAVAEAACSAVRATRDRL